MLAEGRKNVEAIALQFSENSNGRPFGRNEVLTSPKFLTETEALRLTEYHLKQNAVARNSHRKSWLRKHKKIKPKPLL